MNFITTTSVPDPLPALTEPTIQDIHLAERLGYRRPADIRKLIKRHLPTLEAMGLVLHRGAPIVSGKGRTTIVTEYHLNRAQAAFIVAKAGTKIADSLTVKMAEVFALFTEGAWWRSIRRQPRTSPPSKRARKPAAERSTRRRGRHATWDSHC